MTRSALLEEVTRSKCDIHVHGSRPLCVVRRVRIQTDKLIFRSGRFKPAFLNAIGLSLITHSPPLPVHHLFAYVEQRPRKTARERRVSGHPVVRFAGNRVIPRASLLVPPHGRLLPTGRTADVENAQFPRSYLHRINRRDHARTYAGPWFVLGWKIAATYRRRAGDWEKSGENRNNFRCDPQRNGQ